MNLESEALSHIGRRANNEDAFLTAAPLGVFAVADGMGGYEGGEIASRLAVEAVSQFFVANARDIDVTWPYSMDPSLSLVENMVVVSTRLADRWIRESRVGRQRSMGSTLALLVIRDGNAVVGHLGDSRIYRLRSGVFTQLTTDHSLYDELSATGRLDLPSRAEFAYNNVVTKALGIQGADRPDVRTERVCEGDIYLLCSDGLSGVVSDEEMALVLGSNPPKSACHTLVELAYDHGGKDNITAVVVEVLRP